MNILLCSWQLRVTAGIAFRVERLEHEVLDDSRIGELEGGELHAAVGIAYLAKGRHARAGVGPGIGRVVPVVGGIHAGGECSAVFAVGRHPADAEAALGQRRYIGLPCRVYGRDYSLDIGERFFGHYVFGVVDGTLDYDVPAVLGEKLCYLRLQGQCRVVAAARHHACGRRAIDFSGNEAVDAHGQNQGSICQPAMRTPAHYIQMHHAVHCCEAFACQRDGLRGYARNNDVEQQGRGLGGRWSRGVRDGRCSGDIASDIVLVRKERVEYGFGNTGESKVCGDEGWDAGRWHK